LYNARRQVVRLQQRLERSRKKKSKSTDDLTDALLSDWNPSEFENVLVSTQVLAHLVARVPCVECDDTAKTAEKSAEGLSTTIKLRCSACSNKESLPLTASAARQGTTRRKKQ